MSGDNVADCRTGDIVENLKGCGWIQDMLLIIIVGFRNVKD